MTTKNIKHRKAATKSPRARARKRVLLSVLATGAFSFVSANPTLEKFETDYDKGVSQSGAPIQNENRQPVWEDPQVVGGQPDEQMMGVRDRERGQTGVNAAGTIESDGLMSFSDRITTNPEYLELYRRVMDSGFEIGEEGYGHEGHITNLEGRLDNLEDQPGNWQEGAPEPDAFTATGQPGVSEWSPAIGSQTADFTQSRTITQDRQRTVNVYETNVVTGERRLVDTYTESDTQTTTETRLVDVANNPNGGTDGWSAWMNTGGAYSCSGYSPATSTVHQGQRFTQTRTCSQNQERFIYYLPEGDATTERRGTQVVSVQQSRTATGTRVSGVWEFNRFASAADRNRLTTTRASCSLSGCTSRYAGGACGPIGKEIIESGGVFAGGTMYTVYRCERR